MSNFETIQSNLWCCELCGLLIKGKCLRDIRSGRIEHIDSCASYCDDCKYHLDSCECDKKKLTCPICSQTFDDGDKLDDVPVCIDCFERAVIK